MSEYILNFEVEKQILKRPTFRVVNKAHNYIRAAFSFTSDWDDCSEKYVTFITTAATKKQALDDANSCLVDETILQANSFTMYVEGLGPNGKIIYTNPVGLYLTKAGTADGEACEVRHVESDSLTVKQDGNVLTINLKPETLQTIENNKQEAAQAVEAEAGARAAADNRLDEDIKDEASERYAADDALAVRINQEATARAEDVKQARAAATTADTALEDKLNDKIDDKVDLVTYNAYTSANDDKVNSKASKKDLEDAKATINEDLDKKANIAEFEALKNKHANDVQALEQADANESDRVDGIVEDIYEEVEANKQAAAADLNSFKESYAADKKGLDAQDHANAVAIADLKEQLYGYILDTNEDIYNELDAEILAGTTQVADTIYNIADKARTAFTEVKGRTKKSNNLIQLEDKEETTTNGITYSIKNGVITLNGTVTRQTDILLYGKTNDINAALPNGNYYTTQFNSIEGCNIRWICSTNDTTLNNSTKSGVVKVANDLGLRCILRMSSGYSFNNETIKPMLVEGSTAPTTFERGYDGLKSTTFEGVKITNKDKTKTTTLTFNKQTLNGVGSAQDSLVIVENESDSFYTLKHIKRVGLYTFTGNENVGKGGTNASGKYRFSIALNAIGSNIMSNSSAKIKPNILCEAIPTGTPDDTYLCNKGNAITSDTSNLIIFVDGITTTSDMQNYLKDKTMYYELATPIETILKTNLTIDQVSAIREAGGVIEVVGNEGEAFNVKPDVVMTVVYKNADGQPATVTTAEEVND